MGLISSAIQPTSTTAGYDAERLDLDDKDLVAGQIRSIIDEDSPLMQQAETRGMQRANSRGLLNSSMAVGAAQSSLYDAALPIASQDAATNFQAGRDNMAAGNTASQFNAGAANTATNQVRAGDQQIAAIEAGGSQTRLTQAEFNTQQSALMAQKAEIDTKLQTADAATRTALLAQQGEIDNQLQTLRGNQAVGLQELQGSQAMALQSAKAAADVQLQTLKGTQAARITNIEGRFRAALQASASATSLYSGIANSITRIMQDSTLDEANKQVAIDKQIDILESGLTVLGSVSGLDLADLLAF